MLFSRDRNTLKVAFHDNLKGRPEGFEPNASQGGFPDALASDEAWHKDLSSLVSWGCDF
jgi:hypothetical protein